VLADRDLAVVDVHRPVAGALDLEEVLRRQAGGLRRVDSGFQRLEELSRVVHGGRDYSTGSGSSRRLARVEGRMTATTNPGTAAGIPPTATETKVSGATAAMLAINTGRRPTRSAIGPAARVPSPPASSISERRWLPCALEFPIETSHSGTKVISPNQATLRKA